MDKTTLILNKIKEKIVNIYTITSIREFIEIIQLLLDNKSINSINNFIHNLYYDAVVKLNENKQNLIHLMDQNKFILITDTDLEDNIKILKAIFLTMGFNNNNNNNEFYSLSTSEDLWQIIYTQFNYYYYYKDLNFPYYNSDGTYVNNNNNFN